MYKNEITGIILAGGKSRRMGVEKGLARFGGRHLIEHGIEVLEKVCSRILISENSDAYNFLGYEVIPDIFPNSGPMGGVYSALRHSQTDLNLVLSCDMPFISEDFLKALLAESEDKDVVVPWHGEKRFEPLCALYHKKVLPVFEQFISQQNFKIPDAYKKLNIHKLAVSDQLPYSPPYLLKNLNSPEELEEAEALRDQILPRYDRLLLIAGTGRNVGKTSLACAIIKQISKKQPVMGLKISPHVHSQSEEAALIFEDKHFSVFREHGTDSSKDSSRMLKAGAKKVYYIQSEERFVGKAFEVLKTELDENVPIVCESGSLRNFVKPSLFLICRNLENPAQEKHQPLLAKPHLDVEFDSFDVFVLKFEGGKWIANK